MAAASVARIAANRRNALRSTGPRTLEGKRRVSQNALRHGFRSRALLIPGEDPSAFDAFEAELLVSLDPRDALEGLLAHRVVVAAWRLHRVAGVEAALLSRPGWGGATGAVEAFLAQAGAGDGFSKLSRYEATLDRAFVRALRELHRVQAERRDRESRVVDGGKLA